MKARAIDAAGAAGLAVALCLGCSLGLTQSSETAKGAAASRQIEEEIGLIEAAELAAYIEQIGARLAVHSEREDVT